MEASFARSVGFLGELPFQDTVIVIGPWMIVRRWFALSCPDGLCALPDGSPFHDLGAPLLAGRATRDQSDRRVRQSSESRRIALNVVFTRPRARQRHTR